MQNLEKYAHVISEIPFNKIIGLKIDKIEKELLTMHFENRDELIGNYMHGILHGGVISSVLDMAGGAAAMAAVVMRNPERSMEDLAEILGKSSTVNLHIDFLRPGRGKDFVAKSYVIRSGSKISVTRMELFNNDSTLIATGTGTYLIT